MKKIDLKCIKCYEIYNRTLSYKIRNNLKNNDFICKSCVMTGENNSFYGKKHKIETIQKMSKKLSDGRRVGKNNPFYGKKHSQEFCESQRIRQTKWVESNKEKCILGGLNSSSLYERMTGIEIKVQEWLNENNIPNKWSYFFKNKQFDFKVKNYLIEVHGDYWHSLPGKIEVDKLKSQIIEEDGRFILIVILESEINKGDFSKLEILKGLQYEISES
jgi:hypothetical protein